MLALADACYTADDGFTSGLGTNIAEEFSAPSGDFGAGVGTSAGGGFGGGNYLDGCGAE